MFFARYQDISRWNVSNVQDMSGVFADVSFNPDISSWDVSSVTSMHSTTSMTVVEPSRVDVNKVKDRFEQAFTGC